VPLSSLAIEVPERQAGVRTGDLIFPLDGFAFWGKLI
jgi:hypothetical protein